MEGLVGTRVAPNRGVEKSVQKRAKAVRIGTFRYRVGRWDFKERVPLIRGVSRCGGAGRARGVGTGVGMGENSGFLNWEG